MSNDEFLKADPADFTKLVRSYLDPTPNVQTVAVVIEAKTIGVMHVEQHPGRPVIVRSGDGRILKEGDIFFRYPGSCERIKYSDLRAILEGEFDEKSGAPTLKLVGDVTANGDTVATKIVRANITADAVLRNFLTGEEVAHPLDYLAHSAHSNREWQPLWFYVHRAGISPEDAIEHLKKESASQPTHRDGAVVRLSGKRSACNVNNGKPKQLVKAFCEGNIEEPRDDSEAHKFALAVQGLQNGQDKLEEFRTILLKCYERAASQTSAHKNLRSAVFRAACRLDELQWKPEEKA